jgi:hypothetical protein
VNLRRLTVAIIVVCTLITGCGSDNAVNTGPFGNGGEPGSECAGSIPVGRVVTYGFNEFANTAKGTATISKLTLSDSHGLKMLQAWIVPITGYDLYGVVNGYPPEPDLPAGVQWEQRQRPDGARIPESKGHLVYNILVVLKLTARKGTARGIDIYYSDGGQQYHLRTTTSIQLQVGQCAA